MFLARYFERLLRVGQIIGSLEEAYDAFGGQRWLDLCCAAPNGGALDWRRSGGVVAHGVQRSRVSPDDPVEMAMDLAKGQL